MKTRMIVGLGAALLAVALAMSTVSGAFAQTRPTPVPGGMMSPGGATETPDAFATLGSGSGTHPK